MLCRITEWMPLIALTKRPPCWIQIHKVVIPGGGGGYSVGYFWVGVCRWDFDTLTLFSWILRPYSRLDLKNSYSNSNWTFPGKWFPVLDQNSLISIPYPRLNVLLKTLPFTAAHTYIAYIWMYPPSPVVIEIPARLMSSRDGGHSLKPLPSCRFCILHEI